MSRRFRTSVLCIALITGCASQPTEVSDPIPEGNLEQESQVIIDSLTRIGVGTPESLELAILDLEFSEAGSTERGIELQNLAIKLFNFLYPLLDQPTQATTPFSPASIYPALFESVRKGEYPEVSQNDMSFLALVIPPLAILKSTSKAVIDRSRDTITQAKSLNPDSIIPPLLLGVLAEREGRLDEAQAYFTDALALSLRCYPAREGMARVAIAKGEGETAVVIVDELLASLQVSVDVLELAARAYYAAGRYTEASEFVGEAIKRENKIVLLLLLAQILAADGDYAKARNFLTIVEPRLPDNADVLLLKAEIFAKQGDFATALESARRASELYPDDKSIRDAYGRLLVQSGKAEEGREILQESLENSPESVRNLQVLLAESVNSENWEQAALYVIQLLEQDERTEYLEQAVSIYEKLGDVETAAGYAERRYESDTTNIDVLIRYAALLAELGRNGEADDLFAAGLEIATKSTVRSDLYFRRSRLVDAVAEKKDLLGRSLYEYRQNFDAIIAYSAVFESTGELRKAVRYLKEAAALRPEDQSTLDKLDELTKKLGGE